MRLTIRQLKKLIREAYSPTAKGVGSYLEKHTSDSVQRGHYQGGALNTLNDISRVANDLAGSYVSSVYQTPQDARGDEAGYESAIQRSELAAQRLAAFADQISQQSQIKVFKQLIPIDQASEYDAYDALYTFLDDLVSKYPSNRNQDIHLVKELVKLHKQKAGLFT